MNAVAISTQLWRRRHVLLLAATVCTVLAALQLPSLRSSNALDDWYPAGDPALEAYRDFERRFGNDELVIVAATAGTSFESPDGMRRVADLTDQLYYVDGVLSVTSISTVPAGIDARNRLISQDGRTVAFLVQLEDFPDIDARRPGIHAAIRESFEQDNLQARLGGYGVIYETLNTASTEDSVTLIAAAHALMLLLLTLCFRRIVPVVATLITVGAATSWTLALFVGAGHQINMVTMALPTLVMVITVADCVHVLRAVARQDGTRADRSIGGLSEVLKPCLLTSVATAAGFAALAATDLPIVQSLGLFGALGMILGFLAAFTILPAFTAWLRPDPRDRDPDRADRAAVLLYSLGARHPRKMLTAFSIALVAGFIGILRIEVDTYSIGYLSDRHQARLDSDFIEEKVGPYAPIDFVITGHDLLSGSNLDALQQWQRDALALPEIDWSWSILDALGIDADTRPSLLPDGELRGRIASLQILFPDIANSLIDKDGLRVTFGAPMMSAREVSAVVDQISARAHARSVAGDVSAQPAGYAHLYTRIVDRIVQAQITGFGLALLLVVMLLGLATRSLARCLLALPANALPVFVTLGLMGWLRIPLDVATATIATVILGLVVDDTVHVLHRTEHASTLSAGLLERVRSSGGALIVTTWLLAAGFAVLGLADVRSIAWFGLLSAFALLVALATDLLLLPALAKMTSGRAPVRRAQPISALSSR